MYNTEKPYIASETTLPEITCKVIILSFVLTVILAMSNAYLALKIGILASASIPAAIISMGVLRFYRNTNILQNNLVQTAASAGEAVAGGVVYTVPALILIHYWQGFSYWENFIIALLGGTLGVLFSIPLRRVLMTQRGLPFPEGQAVAQVLIAGTKSSFGFREIVLGGVIGGLLEFAQMGLQILASGAQFWVRTGQAVWGFGVGFSPTMVGVGYLIGIHIAGSMLIGAGLGWFCGIPLFSLWHGEDLAGVSPTQAAMMLWNDNLRYIGIGAMLVAGLCSLLSLVKPFIHNVRDSLLAAQRSRQLGYALPRTERDMPLPWVLVGISMIMVLLFLFFYQVLPLSTLAFPGSWNVVLLITVLLYVLLMGFIFSAISGYFSGLVGVTASPGSAIIIAGLLIAAVLLRMAMHYFAVDDDVQSKLAAAAITIFLGAIITSAASIANDNMQDLKVGHIVGATPWKQQLMLIFGVAIAAAVIPVVMALLFNVYGIGDVLPRPTMDPAQALPAPPAAVMAAVTQGVFDYKLPWHMIGLGGGLVLIIIAMNRFLLPARLQLSALGIAMGIYLPLATSVPLFIGGLLNWLTKRGLQRRNLSSDVMVSRRRRGILIACGLVSGAALMNIALAIPFVIAQSPNALRIVSNQYASIAQGLSIVITVILAGWIYCVVCRGKNE